MPMQQGDMLVNLMNLPEMPVLDGIQIKRVFPADRPAVLKFIAENFSEGWVNETDYAIHQCPPKCFVAVKEHRVIGFSCYDASAPDFFGPIGVNAEARGRNVGTALLLASLYAMREEGYVYAVIGWVGDAAEFYRKTVGAEFIPGGTPQNSVYRNMLHMD